MNLRKIINNTPLKATQKINDFKKKVKDFPFSIVAIDVPVSYNTVTNTVDDNSVTIPEEYLSEPSSVLLTEESFTDETVVEDTTEDIADNDIKETVNETSETVVSDNAEEKIEKATEEILENSETEKVQKEEISEPEIIESVLVEENDTKEVNPVMNYLLIDIENLSQESIAGMYKLTKNDNVYVAYKRLISDKTEKILKECPATVNICKVPGYLKNENAADEFLMMEGIKQATIANANKQKINICVISNDTDLQKLYEFAYQFKKYVSVNIFASIKEYSMFAQLSKTEYNKSKQKMSAPEFYEYIKNIGVFSSVEEAAFKNLFEGAYKKKEKSSKVSSIQNFIFTNAKLCFEDKIFIREQLDRLASMGGNLFAVQKAVTGIKTNTVAKNANAVKIAVPAKTSEQIAVNIN